MGLGSNEEILVFGESPALLRTFEEKVSTNTDDGVKKYTRD